MHRDTSGCTRASRKKGEATIPTTSAKKIAYASANYGSFDSSGIFLFRSNLT